MTDERTNERTNQRVMAKKSGMGYESQVHVQSDVASCACARGGRLKMQKDMACNYSRAPVRTCTS